MRCTILLSVLLTACVGQAPDEVSVDAGVDAGSGSDVPVCVTAHSYIGFGGDALEASRPAMAAGSDRLRQKPYAVLAAEYKSALGLATFDTTAYAATFGKPPARWYAEPSASANTIYAAYALAFDACSQQTAAVATYANAPTAANADMICREYAAKAWHRPATDAEAAACATFALDKTSSTDSPAKRWAYTCAAVLSATSFLTF